jgi:hypothetical protein
VGECKAEQRLLTPALERDIAVHIAIPGTDTLRFGPGLVLKEVR